MPRAPGIAVFVSVTALALTMTNPSAPPRPVPPVADETAHMLRGALWMLGAVAAFSAMAMAGRAVSLDLDTFEIMAYRSLFGIVVVLAVARAAGTLHQVNTGTMGLHLGRNICHFAGQNLWFFALTAIPLAQVFALEFTGPIWVLLLSPLFLGERLTPIRMLSGLIGFAGILIVTRPSPGAIDIGTIAAAAAAIGFAGSAICTKLLTRRQSLTTILFWMVTLQALMGLACAGADGRMALPGLSNLPGLAVISLGGLGAHFCLTRALSLAPAGVVMPVDFLRLPLIAVIGYLVYQEQIDPWVFVGGAIIFVANYVNIVTQTRRAC